MKKRDRRVDFVFVLLAVALLTAWQAARQSLSPGPANNLVGTWQDEAGVQAIFQADGTVKFAYPNTKYAPRTGTYRVDFNKQPAELDAQLGGEALFACCEFTSQGALRVSEGSATPANRPRTFGSYTLVLHRQP